MSPGEIAIRRLMPADVAVYRDIRLEALRLNAAAYGSTFAAESARPLGWFEQRLASTMIFGALAGEALLGTAGFHAAHGEKEAHKGRLWGMYVRPAARGTGVGRKLCEAVIALARDRVDVVQLSVVRGNESARRLYAALGFVEWGLERKALKQDGRYVDEVHMALDLAPGDGPGDSG